MYAQVIHRLIQREGKTIHSRRALGGVKWRGKAADGR
jgi:hypothetical protein